MLHILDLNFPLLLVIMINGSVHKNLSEPWLEGPGDIEVPEVAEYFHKRVI